MSAGAALEEIDLTAIVAAFREATDRHGHSAASDADLKLRYFSNLLTRLAMEAGDVAHEGDRQNLPVAYRRCAKLAAAALSTMRRIRVEQELLQ